MNIDIYFIIFIIYPVRLTIPHPLFCLIMYLSIDCWTVLLHVFAVVEDKLLAAQNILAAMENNYNKAYLLFFKNVLNIINEATGLVKNKCLEFYIRAALEI